MNTVHGNSRQIDTSAATTINTNTSTMMLSIKPPAFTLPDGRPIDGKNKYLTVVCGKMRPMLCQMGDKLVGKYPTGV